MKLGFDLSGSTLEIKNSYKKDVFPLQSIHDPFHVSPTIPFLRTNLIEFLSYDITKNIHESLRAPWISLF